MIGDDQLKGYPDDHLNEEKGEGFQERKKRALESIGKTEEETTEEEREQIAKKNLQDSEKNINQKITSMQHDMIIIRQQLNETVKLLNNLQIGFMQKQSDMQAKIMAKIEGLKK